MILSMTGYGSAQTSVGDASYSVEVRSLNNRYFKATIKLPEHLVMFEGEVEKLLRSRLTRGSVVYHLRVRDTEASSAADINLPALEKYLTQLNQLALTHQIRVDIGPILTLPGVCQTPELDEEQLESQWQIISRLTEEALGRMIEMRRVEGQALRRDLLSQCTQIRHSLSAIAELAPQVVKDYYARLLQRTNDLLSDVQLKLEMADLAREVAIYAERSDINEEISRLSSHLEQFERLCDSREPAGRKLDFLAQEMLREVNTIGSKANSAAIATHVIDIKGAIDRLKEQVQNIE